MVVAAVGTSSAGIATGVALLPPAADGLRLAFQHQALRQHHAPAKRYPTDALRLDRFFEPHPVHAAHANLIGDKSPIAREYLAAASNALNAPYPKA